MENELKDKCRVCLNSEDEMHDIFEEFDKGITLLEIFTNTTGFEVDENDVFSSYLCQNCTRIVVDFYNLKVIFLDNEAKIAELLTTFAEQKDGIVENEQLNDGPSELFGQPEESPENTLQIKVENVTDHDDCSLDDEVIESGICEPNIVYAEESKYLGSSCSQTNSIEDYVEVTQYSCSKCGDCFLYKEDIANHMQTEHSTSEENCDYNLVTSSIKVKKEDEVGGIINVNKCRFCQEEFSDSTSYKYHLDTHKKKVCEVCGAGFTRKSYLVDHMEVHSNEKKHVCRYCNKAFRRRTVLVKHRRIHTHPRECVCEVCGKAFNDKGTLKTHIKLIHIKDRNYTCVVCGLKFPLKSTLDKHIRRHENRNREFFCTQCPAGYRDKSSLDRHYVVKHSGKHVRYDCENCGKHYSTGTNLKKHKRIGCSNVTIMASHSDDVIDYQQVD